MRTRYSDHFLITEAWRKAEQFQSEARSEQLLAHYRKSEASSWRYSLAHLLNLGRNGEKFG